MNQIESLSVRRPSLAAFALVTTTGLAFGQTIDKTEMGKDTKLVIVLRDGDCGSETITRVKEVANRLRVDITIEEVIVENEEQAKALNWPGSPTVRIKGLDIDNRARGKTSYAMT